MPYLQPQFGILFPVALAAAHQWRAFASASVTAAALAGILIAAFGTGVWQALPHEFAAQTTEVFLASGNPSSVADWGYIQTVYGLVRLLNGDGATAWLTQGLTTIAVALIVWLVRRFPARYSLKAAADAHRHALCLRLRHGRHRGSGGVSRKGPNPLRIAEG
jgi:hypothetical protein